MSEQQSLLSYLKNESFENPEQCSCDEWSDRSSSCASDSESSVPDWEPSIRPSGELLFIDCDPVVSSKSNPPEIENGEFSTKKSTRRSTRSKFLRLLRRKDSKRHSKHVAKFQETSFQFQDNKVTFQDYEEGEIREVVLKIEQENRKLGRRATAVESLLGLTVSTLSDGNRVMIAGFIPDSEAAKKKNIKIGDWLKSINNIELTFQNLNTVLDQITAENEVVLKLQRVAGVEVTKNPPMNEICNQSDFVQQLMNVKYDKDLSLKLSEYPVGVAFINTGNLTETGPEFEGVSYCYPRPYEKNILCLGRGIFITLNHLLQDISKTEPDLTSVIQNGQLLHIVYRNFGSKVLLFMLPNSCISSKEFLLVVSEIIRVLEFVYQTIDNSFEMETKKEEIDHFFARFFIKILNRGEWTNISKIDNLSDSASQLQVEEVYQFEEVLSSARYLSLPEEVQMQIDDALSELEASDYREWNEDPLDCQRLFTILGSALYHKGYLLASHMVHDDFIDVHSFCKQQGLFHLSRSEPVRSLVLWKEVFPSSCNRGLKSDKDLFITPEDGKHYLLVVGSRKDLLAVLMEAGGCTEPAETNMGPDAFYVEEAQATLAHLQDLGISNIASHWIATNPGLQVVVPEIPIKRKTDFLGTFTKSVSPSPSKDSTSTQVQKKPEVTSILKRRSSDQALHNSNSSFSLYDENSEIQSEDSMSQGGYSERSEVSDEPVLGRRAIREKRNLLESDDESDIEDYRDGSQSHSSYDLSELRQSLLAETAEIKPSQLTAGTENVLFHYVQLDLTEGLLLCPPENYINSKTFETVLNNFRKCSQQIHTLFQNTLRFKNIQDVTKSVINKSLIAIKEHGTLFECSCGDDGSKKFGKLRYWVIGRLFYIPHPREVYICYQDTVPQNIIEIAFKLGVTSG